MINVTIIRIGFLIDHLQIQETAIQIRLMPEPHQATNHHITPTPSPYLKQCKRVLIVIVHHLSDVQCKLTRR